MRRKVIIDDNEDDLDDMNDAYEEDDELCKEFIDDDEE